MIRIDDVRKVGGSAKPAMAKPAAKKASGAASDTSPAAEALRAMLVNAAKVNATAIHIEPQGSALAVRYRVDGLLRNDKPITVAANALGARVKVLANLDRRETRVPQDGKFQTLVGGKTWVVRATVLPVADGEKIVLHLAEQTAEPHDLQKLGYWGQALHALTDAATQPHGLVMVGGPADSGKAATLYGLLHIAADPSRSVATVEDPIEHRFAGITQTPVNTRAGMSFGSTLRAVLHQDPNIIMVSNIADPETTSLVLQASLAGRLALAGMHTHDVAATIARLVVMHAEPYVVASAMRAIANQRLVRRLCVECREPYKIPVNEFTAVCTALGLHGEAVTAHIAGLLPAAAADLGLPAPEKSGRMWRAKDGGCASCGGTGYKGRMVVAEVLTMSPALQKLVLGNATGAAVYDQAMKEGMVPLPLDGLVKAQLGITSLQELTRVITE